MRLFRFLQSPSLVVRSVTVPRLLSIRVATRVTSLLLRQGSLPPPTRTSTRGVYRVARRLTSILHSYNLYLPPSKIRHIVRGVQISLNLRDLRFHSTFRPLLRFGNVVLFLRLITMLLLPIRRLVTTPRRLIMTFYRRYSLVITFVTRLLPRVLTVSRLPRKNYRPVRRRRTRCPYCRSRYPTFRGRRLRVKSKFFPYYNEYLRARSNPQYCQCLTNSAMVPFSIWSGVRGYVFYNNRPARRLQFPRRLFHYNVRANRKITFLVRRGSHQFHFKGSFSSRYLGLLAIRVCRWGTFPNNEVRLH